MIACVLGKGKIYKIKPITGSCVIMHKRVVANGFVFIFIIRCRACSQSNTGQQAV